MVDRMVDSSENEVGRTMELVRRAQRGEQEALERLFSRYYDAVRVFARHRLAGELRVEADSVDIMQETFMHAVETFDRFEIRDDAKLIHWLSRIAENRIRTLARRAFAQKRDRRRQEALRVVRESIRDGSLHLEPAADVSSPSEVAEQREDARRLKHALGELTTEHREVIRHRAYGKRSWREIAELMGRPSEGAARQLHTRALVALAAKMKGRRPA